MINKIINYIIYKKGYLFIFIFFSIIYFVNFPINFFVGGDSLAIFLNTDYYKNTFLWADSTLLGGVANRGVYISMILYSYLLKLFINFFGILIGQYIYNYLLYVIMSLMFYYGIEKLLKNKIHAILITLFVILSSVGWWVVAHRGLLFISLYFFSSLFVGRIIIESINNKIKFYGLFILGILILPIASNPGYFFAWVLMVLLYLIYYILFDYKDSKIKYLKKISLSILILLIPFIPIFTSYGIFFTQNTSLVNDSWNRNILIKGSLNKEKKENIILNTLRGYKSFQNANWGYNPDDLDEKNNFIVKKIDNNKGNYYYSFPGHKIYYSLLFYIISWIPILIIIFGFLYLKEKENKNKYLYWLFILLFSVFLMKSIAPPFGNLFNWMMNNIPMFGIFRSPQVKFSILYLISISFCFIILFNYLYINKKKNITIIISSLLIVYIILMGYYWFIGKAIPKIKLIKDIPSFYTEASDYIKTNSSKIIILPFNVGTWTNTSFGYEGYSLFYVLNPETGIWNRNDGAFYKQSDKILYSFAGILGKKLSGESLLNNLSKFNIDTIIYDGYTDRFPRFRRKETHLENLKFLKESGLIKVKEYGKISIWKTPKEYLTNNLYSKNKNLVKFKKISPVRYDLTFKNLKKDELIFLQSFHKQWVIYPKLNSANNFFKNLALGDIIYLFSDNLKLEHKKANIYGNKWIISNSNIENQLTNNLYTKNGDGSINTELTLYFKPQLYYYVGIIITIFLYFIAFILILYYFFKNKKGKK